MALEGGFFKRILRGPETGSGSGGEGQAEDPDAKRKRQVADQIDTILADDSVTGDVRIAFQEFKTALGTSTVAEAMQTARGLLLNADDQGSYDELVAQYRIRNGQHQRVAASDATPAEAPVVATDVPAQAPTGEAEIDVGAAAPVVDVAQPRVELSEEGQRREAARAKKYVDDIEERFTQKGKGNARKELKRVKGAVPDSIYQEVVKQLAARNVQFDRLPGENGAAESADSRPDAPVPAAAEPVPAQPAEPVAPTPPEPTPVPPAEPAPAAAEAPPATLVEAEAETDMTALEQELARALSRGPDDVVAGEATVSDAPHQIYDWKSPAEIEADLGPATGDLRGFPFWDLADDSAVIMRKGDEGALRVGKNGIIKIPGRPSRNESTAWFQYNGDRFGEITNERYEQIIAEMVRANEEHRVRASARAQASVREVRAGERSEERAARGTERPARAESVERITVDDAYVRFLEERTENVRRGVAFENSARNLSPEDRAVFANMLEQKGKIERGLLDSKLADLRREDERAGRLAEATPAPVRVAEAEAAEGFMTSDEALAEFEGRVGRNQRLNTAYREATKRVSLFTLNRVIDRLRKLEGIDQEELERVITRDSRLATPASAPTPAPPAAAERTPRAEERARESDRAFQELVKTNVGILRGIIK